MIKSSKVRDMACDTSRPWTAFYSPNVPAQLTPKYGDMLTMFRDAVSQHADAPAVIYFDQITTYAMLDAQSDALAHWLSERGVGLGHRVAVVTQNIPALPIACLACWKLGAIPVPGNPMYRFAELAGIFADAQPSAVLCQDCDVEAVLAGLAIADLSQIPLILVSRRDGQSCPALQTQPSARVQPKRECLSAIVEMHGEFTPRADAPAPHDPGLILYTSGTTGVPKGAIISHANLAFNAEATSVWCSLDADDRILAIAPLFHITGFVCHMCAAFSAGCAMLLNYRFEPDAVLGMIREHRPTFTIGAITAFNALMNCPEARREDMGSLVKVYSGGAPIPPALRRTIGERLGLEVHTSYGMTELTAPAVMTPLGLDAPERDGVLSIGIPICSTDIRIVDDAGLELPIGVAGELLVRGPQVMSGYWRKTEESHMAVTDGWMHTGDVGFRDDQGWIYLVDRKKDVIIASGFKVWPREVEDVLYAHPAIREAAVIGIPDAYRGETVKACVALVEGAATTGDELVAHCRERLAAYKAPRIVQIMDDLPKTISGKIRRAALRETGAG